MYLAVEKSHKYLRRFLIQHKSFLWHLYKSKSLSCKRRLQKASPAELRILIRFLVCLEKGHVEIRAKNYRALVKSKRINKLIELRQKKAFYLKKSTSAEKISILCQFCSMYSYLLEPLFFERKIKIEHNYLLLYCRMDVVVKVIIDEKEYQRLLEVERKYKEIENSNSKSSFTNS